MDQSKQGTVIPEWDDANSAVINNTANPLQSFVFHNEPAGKKDVEFREQLKAAIDFVVSEFKQKEKSLLNDILGKIEAGLADEDWGEIKSADNDLEFVIEELDK